MSFDPAQLVMKRFSGAHMTQAERDAFAKLSCSDAQMQAHIRAQERAHDQSLRDALRAHRMRALRESGVSLAEDDYPMLAAGEHEQTPAVEYLAQWFKGPRPIAFLVGGVGRGKTVAGAALIAEHGGVGVRSSRLCRLLFSGYQPNVDKFDALMMSPGLLLIDEVGREGDSDDDRRRAREMMFEIVDQRQGRGKTVLTSNMLFRRPEGVTKAKVPEVLSERLCDATVSRLRACGALHSVKGDDMRGAK